MIFVRITAIFALLALVAGAASAQRTGTRIGGNIDKADGAELMQITARCVAERGPDYASKVLETVPGTDAEFRLIRRNAGDLSICMDNTEKAVGPFEMRFTPRPFRTALAEAMLRVTLRKDVDIQSIGDARAWYLVSLDALPDGEDVDARHMGFMEFGDCVILQNPAAAFAFLGEEKGSDEELQKVQSLVPSLSPCVQAGNEIELTIDALRMALTEPAYHRLRRIQVGS